jgi:hypothetical protein
VGAAYQETPSGVGEDRRERANRCFRTREQRHESQSEGEKGARREAGESRMKLLFGLVLLAAAYWLSTAPAVGQDHAPASSSAAASNTATAAKSKTHAVSAAQLEKDFFALIRGGDEKSFLIYVSEGGVNVGRDAQHLSHAEVEDQLAHRTGLYCKLFDSACIQSEIKLDQSNVRSCSYRELLTKSKDVHTAATETTRNGVRQAILVARMKNDTCSGLGLVDFIFNLQSDGWKLFSIP